MSYLVIYRRADWLNCETEFYGPFASHDDAYDFLCSLPSPCVDPATGELFEEPRNNACKYIEELRRPTILTLDTSGDAPTLHRA